MTGHLLQRLSHLHFPPPLYLNIALLGNILLFSSSFLFMPLYLILHFKSLSLDRYTCFYYYQMRPYIRPIWLFRLVRPYLSEDLGSQEVVFGGQGRILKTDSSI
jgi:hypothetical protein